MPNAELVPLIGLGLAGLAGAIGYLLGGKSRAEPEPVFVPVYVDGRKRLLPKGKRAKG